MVELLSIKEASLWASIYLKRNVTPSNISYLIQYGRIRKTNDNGYTLIDKQELIEYYKSYFKREIQWKEQLGEDLTWELSFEYLKEADTTKHVHRLHPYKGKFIPQLVEYFIDGHTDNFKKEVYFQKGDVILDPFCGSGTTLVQANELGIHSIGIDISSFNSLISNVKLGKYEFLDLDNEIRKITTALKEFIVKYNTIKFENRLAEELTEFNNNYFPSPSFKYKIIKREINEREYGGKKEAEFLKIYENLLKDYNIELRQNKAETFLDKWYLKNVRKEISFVHDLIKRAGNSSTKKLLMVILSRTIRSCRATTHADLSTLKEQVTAPYYCSKHGKICKPLFSILGWWGRYCKDTITRLEEFNKLRTDTFQICLTGDSKSIDVLEALEKEHQYLYDIVKNKKIKGIFSSPPYVGLINYHEQHAYAYDLFGFEKKDELEIGALFKGQDANARDSYIRDISDVLNNCKKFMADNFSIFLVANDKYNIYPTIVKNAGMKIINKYKRPVLNRTEKDKNVYCEIIFHIKNLSS